jgi:hypothetical protein
MTYNCAMFAMLFIATVCLANFAIGFALAVHLGHGPPGWQLPKPDAIRTRLRSLLRLSGRA